MVKEKQQKKLYLRSGKTYSQRENMAFYLNLSVPQM